MPQIIPVGYRAPWVTAQAWLNRQFGALTGALQDLRRLVRQDFA